MKESIPRYGDGDTLGRTPCLCCSGGLAQGRPDAIVATERPRGISALNILSGRIASLEAGGGHFADVLIDCNGEAVIARITRQSAEMLGLAIGLDVFAVVKSVTFDRASTALAIAGRVSQGTTRTEKVG